MLLAWLFLSDVRYTTPAFFSFLFACYIFCLFPISFLNWGPWGCRVRHDRETEQQEGSGTPPQCSRLENPMGGGAWQAAVHGVTKSQTGLNDFTFTFHFHALEKEIATHSSVLAWRIPGTGEPVGLPSMGLHRVGHNWSDFAAAATQN